MILASHTLPHKLAPCHHPFCYLPLVHVSHLLLTVHICVMHVAAIRCSMSLSESSGWESIARQHAVTGETKSTNMTKRNDACDPHSPLIHTQRFFVSFVLFWFSFPNKKSHLSNPSADDLRCVHVSLCHGMGHVLGDRLNSS